MRNVTRWAGCAALFLLSVSAAGAPQGGPDWAHNVVVPQARAFRVDPAAPAVSVTGVVARIELVDGVAKTTLDVSVANPGGRAAEAELLLPVPDGAAVAGFDYEGASPTSTARLLPAEEAVSTYDEIVRRLKDPALLEFAGAALVRSSVFPVPAGGTQKVRLRYEHVLSAEGGRWDYLLPRSESLALDVPWRVEVEVRSARRIADVYSPSHDLEVLGRDAHRFVLRERAGKPMEAGDLRLSILLADGPVATTLFTCADPGGEGGWFLLLSGIGPAPDGTVVPKREVTIVLDRSGSMAGEKFDQARAAALQVLEGLEQGEAVRIVDYAAEVATYAASSVLKTAEELPKLRAYLASLKTGGGTNLDAALQAALAVEPRGEFLPIVLFLTDGQPTAGEQREAVIRERAAAGNFHARRVFTFGVGNDVNAPLLDALAQTSRGRATYVRPEQDVELAVADVFQSLAGPIVTDLALEVRDGAGAPSTRLVRDVYPRPLPDLYEDDRLILLGRYTAGERIAFELSGKRAGRDTSWEISFDFSRAQPRNDFVRRLWAMRRIAALEDELRQAGADPAALAALKGDARFDEIVAEMLELSTRHGVLTDSTAFLALEGTNLDDGEALVTAVRDEAASGTAQRSGITGVAFQQNVGINRTQGWTNNANYFYDRQGELVPATSVQTMAGRTFFRRGDRWVDGALACSQGEASHEPDRIVAFGSEEHVELVQRLQREGRAGQLALPGEILFQDGTETVLVRAPEPTEAERE